MNTRTLVLLGALLIIGSAGVVGLGDGSSDEPLPASLSSFRQTARAAARQTPRGADAGPIRAVGVMINSPVHTGADPGSDDAFHVDLAFFGTFERTQLALELELADGGILGIDDDGSALALFRDDRGTDLRKKESPFGPFGMMPRVSEDGRYVVFVVPSDVVPAPGASRLTAEGTVSVLTAHRAEAFTSDEIAFAAGSSFRAGGYEFEVLEVGESGWGAGRSITLRTKRDTAAILCYSLVRADGSKLELSPSMSMNGMGSWQQTLDAEKLPERGRIALEVWQDLKTVAIPFRVETGLGLR
jgi:hypothetical protein